jgi:hypothetical protein
LYFTPEDQGRWNNLVGFDKSPTSGVAYTSIFGRLATDEQRSFQFSKTTDEGQTWSQFEVLNWEMVKNFSATIGLNPDSIFVDWGGKEFVVYGDNNYSVFFPLFEQNAERDPILLRVLVEFNYNNGVWTGYKVADINAPYYYLFTRNENDQIEILSTVRTYEIQASPTLDNQKVVVKWVEPDYIPVTDTTWTFYSSTIYYNARNINGETWGNRRAIENPAGDTVFHKATWMPNVLPNDLTNIPIISLRTALAPGLPNTFQKLYLDPQYVTVGHFDAIVSTEDNQPLSSALQLDGIYPNPAVGLTYASITAPVAGDYNVEIYSVEGEKVKDMGKLFLNEGQSSISINVSDMISGAYYLTVSSGNMKVTKLLNIAR